jgi:hypothetical protein
MLLLDGQQRLTSLSAVLNGLPVEARGRKKPVEILVNLEYELAQQKEEELADEEFDEEFDEEDPDDEDAEDDADDEDQEDEASRSLNLEKRLFVVYSRALSGKRIRLGLEALSLNRTLFCLIPILNMSKRAVNSWTRNNPKSRLICYQVAAGTARITH